MHGICFTMSFVCSLQIPQIQIKNYSFVFQVDDTEVIRFLSSTETVHPCLCVMERGDVLSKTVECLLNAILFLFFLLFPLYSFKTREHHQ